MKIISANIYELCIPFKGKFSHSLKSRSNSDSIIVSITSNSGVTGYGEAVPRPYVTGESVSMCIEHIVNVLLPRVINKTMPELNGTSSLELLSDINKLIQDTKSDRTINYNASIAAVETACIDVILKNSNKSFASILSPKMNTVTYSSIISSGSIEQINTIAKQSKKLGFKHVKMKIGDDDDLKKISSVRNILGDEVSLRLDANGAFNEQNILSLIETIQKYNIASIEQPIPRGDIKALARIKEQSTIPIMVDESLVSFQDAKELIDNKACDLFNLRISKNGGCFKTLKLIDLAKKEGLGYQLGCQVGETAILSAVGRHFAAHFPEIMFTEGSYGTFLLDEDIAKEEVMFDYAGKAPLFKGIGFGIEVNEIILERYLTRKTHLKTN